MQQAHLILIADHSLNIKEKDSIIAFCLQSSIRDLLQEALNIQANLENYKTPDTAQQMEFKEADIDGNLYFSVNNIGIRVSKHLIEFRFPFMFRVIVDYVALRNAYYRWLHAFLSPFQTTAIIELPSFWEYEEHEIRNEWHRRRLYDLQHKITTNSDSFKRVSLNLTHCLGAPETEALDIMKKKYKVWIALSYHDLLTKSKSKSF